MREYIFTERNGIYIIDLQKTVKKIDEAYKFIVEVARTDKPILLLAQRSRRRKPEQEAIRCGMYYVNHRWLGGTLTNWKTIQSRIAYLRKIEQMEFNGEFELLPEGSYKAEAGS